MKSKGIVKWFNDAKGYGFIDLNGKDIFVHYTQIMGDGFKTLTEGQKVEFVAVKEGHGEVALDVVKIGFSTPTAEAEEDCEHGDMEDGWCLDCGEDFTADLMALAYDRAKDLRKYGES